jgi:hypothetical protein
MVRTEFVDIPVNDFGYLFKHRDQWNREHGVWVSFPPHGARVRCDDGSTVTIKRFGNYQTMVLRGLSQGIKTVKRLVSGVLDEASEEREAFKERRSRRMQQRPTPAIREAGEGVQEVRSHRRNMFDGLEMCEDVPRSNKKVVIVGPKPGKARAPQGCWASGSPSSCKTPEVAPSCSEDPELGSWGVDPKLGAWGEE